MITKLEAISFLKQHQPMPNDKELEKNEIEKYEEVRRFFVDNPDEECIPLFLNSFGDKDGFGVYQMVEDVISMYEAEKVLPHILKALQNEHNGIKYWNVQIASNFPNERLFMPLSKLVLNEDVDIKMASISALAQLAMNDICKAEVIDILKQVCEETDDEDVKDFGEEVLRDIQ